MSSAFVVEKGSSGITCTSLNKYLQSKTNNGRIICQSLFDHTPGSNMVYREHAHHGLVKAAHTTL